MERYTLTQLDDNTFRCQDNESPVSCTFEIQKFNETSNYEWSESLFNAETPESVADELASLCSAMGDWLCENHSDVLVPPPSARLIIGAKIRILREEQNLEQDDLAEMAGITSIHLARIESGRYNVRLDICERIVRQLGYRIDLVEE